MGDIEFFGGISWENSRFHLDYIYPNPFHYGCFTDATNNHYKSEITDEAECADSYPFGWHAGVPQDISLSFSGNNNFRKLIGARIRILFVDTYIDYNFGTSNTINAGLGFTFK